MPLFTLLRTASAAELKALTQDQVNAPDADGLTPLMWAAAHRPELIAPLLRRGARPGARDQTGRNALSYARSGAAVRALRSCGLSLKRPDSAGRTALMWVAAQAVEGAAVVRLVEAGAALEARDLQGRTALMWAALNPSPAPLDALLTLGAEVRAVNREGFTALVHAARQHPDPAVTGRLLEAGSPLYPEVLGLAVEVIARLLKAGANPGAQDAFGQTAAAYVALGATPNAVRAYFGVSP